MGRGHIATQQATRLREAKVETMLREPPPKTWSARMLVYCFTELCVDPELRIHPADVERRR